LGRESKLPGGIRERRGRVSLGARVRVRRVGRCDRDDPARRQAVDAPAYADPARARPFDVERARSRAVRLQIGGYGGTARRHDPASVPRHARRHAAHHVVAAGVWRHRSRAGRARQRQAVAVPESRLACSSTCTRRRVLGAGAALASLAAFGRVDAQTKRGSNGTLPALPEFRRLVTANRILANEGVVDAFGHISVRDPRNPKQFVLARSRSPALVELGDLMEFGAGGAALDARGRTPCCERMIHAAVYEARPDVMSVVHHHAYAVLPFTITSTPLKPMIVNGSTAYAW